MGVVIRRWKLVWLGCIGVFSGCCCKEVYIYINFLILLIPALLVIALFSVSCLLLLKIFFFLYTI